MRPYPQKVLDYLNEHSKADLKRLALKSSPFESFEMKALIQQLTGIQVAKKKFPSYLTYPQIRFPKRISLEQSSSEALAKYKSKFIKGESFADLTGGFGVDTFWLGKNMKVIHYVEPNAELQNLAKFNFSILGLPSVNHHEQKAEDFLAKFNGKLDWIYLDPSRREGAERKIGLQGYQPNIYELEFQLLRAAQHIMIKVSPMQDISEIINQLSSVQKIIICEWDKEVKEVLIILGAKNTPKENVPIEVAKMNEKVLFEAKFKDLQTKSIIGPIDDYIFEPGPGLQKSGLNNCFGNSFDLKKIHSHSQLFTSAEPFLHDLGKTFKIEATLPLNKKKILPFLPSKKANVIVRNFPIKAPAIKQKLGIKEGGEIYLIATMGMDNKPIILVCQRSN